MLTVINNMLKDMNINYQFGEYEGELSYPYFVGEYNEIENFTEDNLEDVDFILTGFTRGSYLELEKLKKIIKDKFMNGVTVLSEDKSVTIFYGFSIGGIPTGEMDLKKIQINLRIKVCEVR